MIKAKVTIETARRTYKPGELITEVLSAADLAFLRKHDFITVEEKITFQTEERFGNEPDEDGEDNEGESNEGEIEYKDEAALRNMNKEEIIAYAAGLGLDLHMESLKNDLVDAVLNYIEERTAE